MSIKENGNLNKQPVIEAESFIATKLAEFKALRDESLRCTQMLSNAVWVAVTGYAATVGIAATFLGRSGAIGYQMREDMLMQTTVALLCLEAMAISVIYLSELWKYIRVGYYIREKLLIPMNWEKWIQDHRAYELYFGSLVFLQLPIIMTVLGFVLLYTGVPGKPGSLVTFIGWLNSDSCMTILIIIVLILDVLVVLRLSVRVIDAGNGIFCKPSILRAICELGDIFKKHKHIKGKNDSLANEETPD